MKIMFHIAALTGGGAERVMVTLAEEFAARGEEVMILCRDRTPQVYPITSTVKVSYLQDCLPDYSGSLFNRIKRKILFGIKYKQVIRKFTPDVNIVFTAIYAVMVLPILLKMGIPVICSEHSTVTREYGDSSIAKKRQKLYPKVDAVTVLTRYDYALWKKKPNVVRMPNPFIPTTIDVQHREKVVLAAGRINEWKIKGFDNLIRCWSKLCNEFSEWKLVIAGKYDEKSLRYLKDIVNQTNSERVEFPGFCSNMNEMMSRSEVFCLSSRLEGMPMVLLEAMNAGCACIANNCITGPSEIIINGVNGLLAERDSINDLTDKLRIVMKSPGLRQQFRANSHLSITQYSLGKVIDRWYILFNKLLVVNNEK